MRRRAAVFACCSALSACITPRVPPPPIPWEGRAAQLQSAAIWHLEGRAAVAFGAQGWQASLDWRQSGIASDVRIAGPFGVGALQMHNGPEGLALNGANPSDAGLTQLQQRLGFDLPLNDLRFWLLGVPSPTASFALTRNAEDRAQELQQDGWTIDYERYTARGADVLPSRVVLSREGVRVRIIVDHWDGP